MRKSFLKGWKILVGKKENASFKLYLVFSQFSKSFFPWVVITCDCLVKGWSSEDTPTCLTHYQTMLGNGAIARYEQFLLFPQCFQKACFPGASKGVIVWEWVNCSRLFCLNLSTKIFTLDEDQTACFLQSYLDLHFNKSIWCCYFTFSQMTNFRLLQTEKVRRWQFQILWKWQKVLKMGRKHCRKMRLLIKSNFSFSYGVFKRLLPQICKYQGLFGKG